MAAFDITVINSLVKEVSLLSARVAVMETWIARTSSPEQAQILDKILSETIAKVESHFAKEEEPKSSIILPGASL